MNSAQRLIDLIGRNSKKLQLRLFCLLLYLPISATVFAQQPSYFLLGEDQFEGVQIYDVIQDNALNYWIATDNGIYKYDCYSYTRVTCEGVQGLSVFGFVKNNSGSIFCYNLNHQVLQIKDGVCKLFYELKKEEWSTDMYLSITARNELMVVTKTALLFTEDGLPVQCVRPSRNYYGFPFLTPGGQTICHTVDSDSLLVYEKGKFEKVALDNDGETVKGVLKFFTISGNTYAVSTTEKTVYAFDPQRYSIRLKSPQAFDSVNGFQRFYNENDQLWVAGNISGVKVLTGDGVLNLSATYYPQYLISDVYRDTEGNLLLSTFNHGILIIPNANIPDVLSVADNRSVVSIHTDDQLGMLMGTVTGELLAYKNGSYSTLSNSGSRPLQAVYCWEEFPFLLFDDGKIKAQHKKTGETFIVAKGSLKDATLADHGTLYLALNTGVCKLTLEGSSKFECQQVELLQIRCYAIEYSPADKLVYVATSGGVKILDSEMKATDVMLDGKPVFANDIACYKGTIYLAAKDGIVACKNGKPSATVKTIIQGNPVEAMKLDVQEDRFNTITTGGFAMFNHKGDVLMQLNRTHGFSTNRIYGFEIISDVIWICHAKGIQQLTMAALHAPAAKPLISISAVMVNDKAVLSLAPGSYTNEERKFKFSLSSPTLRNKENIRYHYQLKGYDNTWLVAEFNDHEIIYNALAPGDYTFVVKAENKGVFSEPVYYSFTIEAPYYLRWWFLLATAFLSVLAVALLYRYQLNVQQRKARIINELNLSKLTAIQSQMNPHFIFNSLNSIQDLVLKGDVDNSYSFITKFSNLIRRTLTYSDQEFIEFEQEIKLIELYLSLEKLRFGDALKFEIDVDNVEDILIPPMLIQPFIENALVHGLLHREGEKRLSIRFKLEETLQCVIEDNGVGRAKAKEIKIRQRSEHESFSGHAIKKRFSILSSRFKEELGFKYEDLTENGLPSGTRVTLSIPVKHKY